MTDEKTGDNPANDNADASNVIKFPGRKSYEEALEEQKPPEEETQWTPSDVLAEAANRDLTEVIVIGRVGDDGMKVFHNACVQRADTALFLIEYAKFIITHQTMTPTAGRG